jgi:hypothetical protein
MSSPTDSTPASVSAAPGYALSGSARRRSGRKSRRHLRRGGAEMEGAADMMSATGGALKKVGAAMEGAADMVEDMAPPAPEAAPTGARRHRSRRHSRAHKRGGAEGGRRHRKTKAHRRR